VPRRQSAGTAGLVFHVINRGVKRSALFDSPSDYYRFLALLGQAQRRTGMRCVCYCLMPNHFHLVLWPERDDQLSQCMFWLLTNHARVVHARRGTRGTGYVYQGRFKAIPVASDQYFLNLCRYVERNPIDAFLVAQAEAWPWSSMAQRAGQKRPLKLTDWPVPRPADWCRLVNAEMGQEVEDIRRSIGRNRPYGPEEWRERIAAKTGRMGSLRPIGRPRKAKPGIVS
jgi:putative transposase